MEAILGSRPSKEVMIETVPWKGGYWIRIRCEEVERGMRHG